MRPVDTAQPYNMVPIHFIQFSLDALKDPEYRREFEEWRKEKHKNDTREERE